jgi:hypothetical protein
MDIDQFTDETPITRDEIKRLVVFEAERRRTGHSSRPISEEPPYYLEIYGRIVSSRRATGREFSKYVYLTLFKLKGRDDAMKTLQDLKDKCFAVRIGIDKEEIDGTKSEVQ